MLSSIISNLYRGYIFYPRLHIENEKSVVAYGDMRHYIYDGLMENRERIFRTSHVKDEILKGMWY